VLTGLLGVAFTAAMHLSGVATDDDAFLSATLGGIDMRGLLLAGIVIGVLAYAGASLPLLLLIATGTQPVGDLVTGELLAQEILRSAVGTIGLVASVPMTTVLAVLAAGRGHRLT
jgi:uncharacterized membrane protein